MQRVTETLPYGAKDDAFLLFEIYEKCADKALHVFKTVRHDKFEDAVRNGIAELAKGSIAEILREKEEGVIAKTLLKEQERRTREQQSGAQEGEGEGEKVQALRAEIRQLKKEKEEESKQVRSLRDEIRQLKEEKEEEKRRREAMRAKVGGLKGKVTELEGMF